MRLWLCVLGLIGSVALAQEPGSFTGGLAAEDFRAAGLHKLTAGERAALDDLIAGRERTVAVVAATEAKAEVRAAAAAAEAAAPRVAPEDRIERGPGAARERIESRLSGPFTGWNGRTVFRLENGQRWQQIDGEVYRAVGAPDNAAVTLMPSSFGGYFLKVEGFGSRVRVKLLSD